MKRLNSTSSASCTSENDLDVNYLEIKKEQYKNIVIDYKLYYKLITFFNVNNNILINLKNKTNIIKYSEETQTEQDVAIIETKKEIQNKERIIMDLMAENQKIKENYENLRKNMNNIEKKLNELQNLYTKEIKEKNAIIEKLKKDIKLLITENTANKNRMDNMIYYSPFEKVFNNENNIKLILSYLPYEYYLLLATLNKKIHFHLYYKLKFNHIKKKFQSSQQLISEITSSNIPMKYQVDEENLQKLIQKYTSPHVIPGNPMRYSLFHSLIFLENIVRKPLQEKFDLDGSEKKKSNLFFSDIVKILKNEEFNEITQKMKNEGVKQKLDSKILTIYKDNYKDLKEFDNKILSIFGKDKYINIKFEFTKADDIKTLLHYFLENNLDKSVYVKFWQYLIDEYCELFFNCYNSLESIKELEIVNIALDARYKQNNYLIKQMNLLVAELKNYCETSKNLKETLLKQKNEIEIKYNDCLMLNIALNKKVVDYCVIVDNLKEGKNKMIHETNELIDKMINDYKKIEKNNLKVNNERKTLIRLFLELNQFITNSVNYSKESE